LDSTFAGSRATGLPPCYNVPDSVCCGPTRTVLLSNDLLIYSYCGMDYREFQNQRRLSWCRLLQGSAAKLKFFVFLCAAQMRLLLQFSDIFFFERCSVC